MILFGNIINGFSVVQWPPYITYKILYNRKRFLKRVRVDTFATNYYRVDEDYFQQGRRKNSREGEWV